MTATSVNRFGFLRCCQKMVTDFLEAAKNLLLIKGLVIRDVAMEAADVSLMFSLFEKSAGLRKLEMVTLSKPHTKAFPHKDTTRFLNIAKGLQYVCLRSIDGDASPLLRAIFQADSNLQVLKLTHVQYRSPLDPTLLLPRQLAHLDVSMSAFSHESFKSLFVLLGSGNATVPLVFQARALVIKSTFYADLATLDFDSFASNLCEFDWSLNKLPDADSARYLFAFLFTQKRLRLLTMHDIGIETPMDFLQTVMKLVSALPLSGLDFSSSDVPADVLQMFVQALGTMPHLRRLGIPNSNAGDAGIVVLTEALAGLPDLNELVADGFKCTTVDKLAAFWTAVAAHEALVACDLPSSDLKFLELAEEQLDPEFRETLEALKEKARPSTLEQRVELTSEYLGKQETLDTSGEFLIKTSVMGWTYVADQLGDSEIGDE
jgi:hypothetical protein